MVLNLCTSSDGTFLHEKISQRVSKLFSGHDFQKIYQGVSFRTNVGGVMIFVLCTFVIMIYICTKFCENISNGLGVIVRTLFLL